MNVIKKTFPLAKVYQLLEPGSVVMVTTAYKDKVNAMTMAWYTMIDFNPPMVGCIISDQDYSFNLLKKSKECVINIPTVELAAEVVGVGSTTGSKIDKFKKFNLTTEPASLIAAPLINECYANLECKVIDMHMASKYNLFIVEVIKAWISPAKKRPRMIHHCGNGVFIVDGKVIKLPFQKK
jgi:flavin reductase (DIM6/NTAB) family NADH-FMN oxidoreductase RutF